MLRSLEQHNYEWVCYRLIASETGDTPYSVYEFFAKLFLKEHAPDGSLVYRKPTSLEDWEHSGYIAEIHHFISKFYPDFIWPEKRIMNPEFKPIK